MVKITKISIQKRNKSRYNLFLDRGNGEEFGFGIDEDLLIKHQLRKGMEMEEEALLQLVDEDEQRKAYHQAIHYLSFRMRSAGEVRDYLVKKDREERHIDTVIEKLTKERLLDDQEFAGAYIRTKKRTTLKGPLVLKNELLEKGVHPTIIEEMLEAYSHEEQVEMLQKWLDKQTQRSKTQSHKAYVDKVMNQMLRRGFSMTVIREAIDQSELINEESEQWEAICHQGNKALNRLTAKYDRWEAKQRMKQFLYRKGFTFELIERYIRENLE